MEYLHNKIVTIEIYNNEKGLGRKSSRFGLEDPQEITSYFVIISLENPLDSQSPAQVNILVVLVPCKKFPIPNDASFGMHLTYFHFSCTYTYLPRARMWTKYRFHVHSFILLLFDLLKFTYKQDLWNLELVIPIVSSCQLSCIFYMFWAPSFLLTF